MNETQGPPPPPKKTQIPKAHQTRSVLLLLSASLLLCVPLHVCMYVQEKASFSYLLF